MNEIKTSEQCRGHHKKMIERYRTIDGIVEFLEAKKFKHELKELEPKKKRHYTKRQKTEKKQMDHQVKLMNRIYLDFVLKQTFDSIL